MSHAMRVFVVATTALAALASSRGAAAQDERGIDTAPQMSIEVAVAAASVRTNAMGVKPLDLKSLARRRGGTDVFNDLQLKGVVADNRAVNVTTGANMITDGAFAGTTGLPMVVQNSGNNVLIQNATIVNVQVK